jgi:membrane protease YdiL (CAAX protease family)
MKEAEMKSSNLSDNIQPVAESTSVLARVALVAFCLAAGLSYRILIGVLPPNILQAIVLASLSALLLLFAMLAKRSSTLNLYWEIPFAFFIFMLAGVLGDQGGFIQKMLTQNVLHTLPTANNPLGSTVIGSVLAQLVSTACLVIPIILLTKLSGSSLKSILLTKSNHWWVLLVGVVAFILFYLVGFSGRAQRFFPNHGVTHAQYLALTPALLILVLCNGLREELWFRGLFLRKYGKFLSPFSSNLLSAVIFTSFHVQIQYTPSLLPFLLITLILGLVLGFLTQKSGSILASVFFHAGSDIPIFLVYLSYVI